MWCGIMCVVLLIFCVLVLLMRIEFVVIDNDLFINDMFMMW